ncbi:hypothetical protein [Telmatospirillum siberiense]|uniref:Uncharacterized protein n=1 Tax=Telmatospirillum siberiense TaxID=382514 RepID=A0A2N3PWE3_9PROT|nr:hypothetical protein [Telmatospirillum siberiense]PKU24717.1 hypothetical protein CWS72_10310 [Telmatospirillum siberiense]
MKRRKIKGPPVVVVADFARGFVATALLAAIQKEGGERPRSGRAVLRRAVQGGAALAAGTAVADALRRRRYADALLAAAGGGAGILAAELLLAPVDQSSDTGEPLI